MTKVTITTIIPRDFKEEEYLEDLNAGKTEYSNSHSNALDPTDANYHSILGYGYKGGEEISGLLYRDMVNRILQTVLPDSEVDMIKFEWYLDNGILKLNKLGLDVSGSILFGNSVQPVTMMYTFIKSSPTPPAFQVSEQDIYRCFKLTPPASGKTITLQAIIQNIQGHLYFALATAVPHSASSPSYAKPFAYGPPCPPECYDRS